MYDKWIPINTEATVYVPADMPCQLKLSTPYNQQLGDFTFPDTIQLSQGETLDLGPCYFKQGVPVCVKVVDSQGLPLEGFPVRMEIQKNRWSVPHMSNIKGVTSFYMIPNTSGKFGACRNHNKSRGGSPLIESIEYTAGDTIEPGQVFEIVLSEEFLGR